MNLLDRGKLFTTEPELNRALASEMRFDPTATQTLMRDIIGITGAGPFESVTCERADHANLDILVTFEKAKVGVECRLGHQLSQAQWEAQLGAVDRLIAIVKDTCDVPEEAVSAGVLVCTWSRAPSVLRNSRVGIDDGSSSRSNAAGAVMGTLQMSGSVHPEDFGRSATVHSSRPCSGPRA